jgi:2-polyprenyl-6-methoxyphenol hydroxylase-like FAD-dependent oxidoreductase
MVCVSVRFISRVWLTDCVQDENDIGESWSFPGNKDDALHFLDEAHFSENFREIVRCTPEKNLVDYKLVWRDPLETWITSSARGVVIGDAAHCHLPTSGQGGCQAIEDGVTLAVCLEKARGDVQLALKVFERIRFNRSHVIHQSSISNRDTYHNADFSGDYLVQHPELMNVPRPNWVVDHDARANAEEHFEHLAADIKRGKPGTLQELSLPADGNYEDETLRVYKNVRENVLSSGIAV